MSWLSINAELRGEDWGLLDFEPSPSEAFVISKQYIGHQPEENGTSDANRSLNLKANRQTITKRLDLDQWLADASVFPSQQDNSTNLTDHGFSTINLLLAAKTSSLDQIPFIQSDFANIMSKMKIHRSIVRAINRNTSCTFAAITFDWPCSNNAASSVVYNCRTAASWDGDMALSVTFFPESLTTNAVWYGCDLEKHNIYGHMLTDADIITNRLTDFDGSCFHPMILPTIFADLERERQIGLVRKCLTQFVQRIHDLAYPMSQAVDESDLVSSNTSRRGQYGYHGTLTKPRSLLSCFHLASRLINSKTRAYIPPRPKISLSTSSTQAEDDREPAVLLWQDISFLRIGLQNWQIQLRKMIDQVNELNTTCFRIRTGGKCSEMKVKLALREVGVRIKIRLQDLVDEYDEYIRQCTHIMEGLSLATQLELNNISRNDARTNQEISRVNLEVAQMARLDGSLMKSIATLGMVFLPATFVSTFFSMGFFQWTEENDKGKKPLSPYFWVYIAVAVGLTLLTMAIFYTCVLRAPSVEVDEERKAA